MKRCIFVGMVYWQARWCYILLIGIYLDVKIMALRDGSAARSPARLRVQGTYRDSHALRRKDRFLVPAGRDIRRVLPGKDEPQGTDEACHRCRALRVADFSGSVCAVRFGGAG